MSVNPHSLTPVELVVDRLRDRGCNPRTAGGAQWSAKCPNVERHSRGDRNPSLSLGEGPSGKALLHCHTGCTVPEVARSLNLDVRDLFPERPLATIDGGRRVKATYDYYDVEGTLIFQVVRYEPKGFSQRRPDDKGGWVWGLGGIDHRPLYHAPQVAAAVASGKPVWIVEGEKDAEALQWAVEGATTTNAGGATHWREEHTAALDGADVVHIVQDADESGLQHARTVAKAIRGVVARVIVHRPPDGFKDSAEALGAGRTIDDFELVWDSDGDDEELGEADETDWAPIDLAAIAAAMRDGSYQPITPTVLGVDGASPLFYAGRINQLFGESGGGKTWVSLAGAAEVVRGGGRVLLIDYEDTPSGIAERLLFLGLTDAEIALVDYRNPSTGIGMGIAHLAEHVYQLVVLDSTGEAMASGAVNPNADDEVALWFRRVKELVALEGAPAVVVLDHVPKDREAPSSYAIGSQRKRAAVTGAAYRVDTIKEPAKGRDGKLKLTVAKDRPGNRAKGTVAAEVEITSGEAGAVAITLHRSESAASAEHGERFRPTVLMERVSRWLEINPGASQKKITDAVEGKRTGVLMALEVLIDEGWVGTAAGQRNSVEHTVVTAFREGDLPVDNTCAGTPAETPPVPIDREQVDSDDLFPRG